jgi:hypothetical protein
MFSPLQPARRLRARCAADAQRMRSECAANAQRMRSRCAADAGVQTTLILFLFLWAIVPDGVAENLRQIRFSLPR